MPASAGNDAGGKKLIKGNLVSDNYSTPPSEPSNTSQPAPTDRDTGGSADDESRDLWSSVKRYLIIAGIALVGILIAAAVIPRWWAQQLGNLIDGSLTTGSLTGIALGVVCAAVPTVLLIEAARRKVWGSQLLWYLIPSLAFAFPLLATFWIAAGSGSGAKAGRRILDVDGPGVRGGALVGAIIGLVLAIGLEYKLSSRRKEKRNAENASS